jgi:hypothetical protein
MNKNAKENQEYDKNQAKIKKIKQKYKQMSIKQIQNKKINQKYTKIEKKSLQNKNIKRCYQETTNQKLQDNKIRKNYDKLIQEKPIYRIINSLSTRIRDGLTRLKIERTFKYTDVLGCTINEFETYLLEHMKDGMTFANYGEWEVDHIIPFSHFDFHIFSDIINCCEYHNLQPLWQPENRKKYNKLVNITDF